MQYHWFALTILTIHTTHSTSLPFVSGMLEKIKRVFKKGVTKAMQPICIIGQVLPHPPTPRTHKLMKKRLLIFWLPI